MPFVTSHMSISLDGFVAGPDQSQDNPLGVDAIKLHHWHLDDPKHPADDAFTRRLLGPRGAYIMGRKMFGPVRGEWGQSDWRGWWGPEPPYHAPVFVLTHHALQRLAERCGVRTPDDMLAALKDIWGSMRKKIAEVKLEAEDKATLKAKANEIKIWKLPFSNGVAIVEKTRDIGFVVKTVLDDEMT